jgi:hypothetical protein
VGGEARPAGPPQAARGTRAVGILIPDSGTNFWGRPRIQFPNLGLFGASCRPGSWGHTTLNFLPIYIYTHMTMMMMVIRLMSVPQYYVHFSCKFYASHKFAGNGQLRSSRLPSSIKRKCVLCVPIYMVYGGHFQIQLQLLLLDTIGL